MSGAAFSDSPTFADPVRWTRILTAVAVIAAMVTAAAIAVAVESGARGATLPIAAGVVGAAAAAIAVATGVEALRSRRLLRSHPFGVPCRMTTWVESTAPNLLERLARANDSGSKRRGRIEATGQGDTARYELHLGFVFGASGGALQRSPVLAHGPLRHRSRVLVVLPTKVLGTARLIDPHAGGASTLG